MAKLILAVIATLLFVSVSTAASCFVFGAEGTTSAPPAGYSFVTLDQLRGSLGSAFVDQYNAGGIPFIPNLSVGNCLASFGYRQCPYANNYASDWIVPFTLNGAEQCTWDNPPGPVKLGTWIYGTFYRTLNQSVFYTWTNANCTSTYTHYTLLYNNTCSSQPTPPPAAATCCFYFSHPLNYQSAFCQKAGNPCPDVSGYVLVYNQTSTCDKCTLSALPNNILAKYSSMAAADTKSRDEDEY